MFATNGFLLSDGLIEQLPEEFRKKYFEPGERDLLFLLFELKSANFINSEEVDEYEFENVFGLSKRRYFSAEAIDDWSEQGSTYFKGCFAALFTSVNVGNSIVKK